MHPTQPNAETRQPFRVAIASDGSLHLFTPENGHIELERAHAETLVDYLRKLDALSAADRATAPVPGANEGSIALGAVQAH